MVIPLQCHSAFTVFLVLNLYSDSSSGTSGSGTLYEKVWKEVVAALKKRIPAHSCECGSIRLSLTATKRAADDHLPQRLFPEEGSGALWGADSSRAAARAGRPGLPHLLRGASAAAGSTLKSTPRFRFPAGANIRPHNGRLLRRISPSTSSLSAPTMILPTRRLFPWPPGRNASRPPCFSSPGRGWARATSPRRSVITY